MNESYKKYIQSQEVVPPPEVWTAIESELDKKSKKRFPVGYFAVLSAILLSGGILFGVFYNWEAQPSTDVQPQSTNTSPTSIQNSKASSYDASQNPSTEQHSQNAYRMDEATLGNHQDLIQRKKKVSSANLQRFPNQSTQRDESIEYRNSNKASQQKNPSQNSALKDWVEISTSDKPKPSSAQEFDTTEEKPDYPIEEKPQNSLADADDSATPIDEMPASINKTQVEESLIAEKSLEVEESTLEKEEDLAENEIKIVKKKNNKEKKWEFSTYIAPSYTRSITDKHIWLIDLKEYKGSYENSTNYGMRMSYTISSKWTVRAGLGINNLRQKARDVYITSQTLDEANITQIDTYENIEIINSQDFYYPNINPNNVDLANVSQQIQYFSVPIDFSYQLYDSSLLSLGLNLGTSTHWLRKNSIALDYDNRKFDYGKATNLNELVFGTQLGFQTRFKINSRFSFMLEPEFLYYFNTFKDDSKVRPYTINLSAGLLYKFNF